MDKSQKQVLPIGIGNWQKYFENLLNTHRNNTNQQFYDYVTESLPKLNKISTSRPLDHVISEQEVNKYIKHLRNGKAVGPDLVCNEMLKEGLDILLQPLIRLFNTILNRGEYPANWKVGYIPPIHKKGNTLDPTNYRGVTVFSCLSKVFTHMLTWRLDNCLTINSKWSKNQCGFNKSHRTEYNNNMVLKGVILFLLARHE